MAINIFISYYTIDADKKDILKQLIKDKIILVPLVVEDNESNNKDFGQKVKEYFEISHYFIPIITSISYKESQWLNQEIGYAFGKINENYIIPITDKKLVDEKTLKGFIHSGQKEMSFQFEANNNKILENESFKIQALKVIDKILSIEKLDGTTGVKFQSLSLRKDKIQEIPLPIFIQTNSGIVIKIKQFAIEQRFRFYFVLKSAKGYKYYLGFTNAGRLNEVYSPEYEYSKVITDDRNFNFEFKINIYDHLTNSIKEYNKLHPKRPLTLTGSTFESVRFSGDKNIDEEIEYSYYKYTFD